MNKAKVIITDCYRWSYFQWFVLGFFELKKQGFIDFEFDVDTGSKLLALLNNKYVCRLVNHVRSRHEIDSYNLKATILYPDGKQKKFVIDSADAPFLFDSSDLDECDCYFKMQYPIDLDRNRDFFALTDKINIPWCDHQHEDRDLLLTQRGKRKDIILSDIQRNKIKPLMVGPRRLSRSLTYNSLKKGYENYLSSFKEKKQGKMMCYFGNSLGPEPELDVVEPDYDWEKDIVGYFGEKIQHPNEKRAMLSQMIRLNIQDSDVRIISKRHADSERVKNDKIVPLEQFCEHISNFQYNCNVSGYRMSIPNRFIESFIVGTEIFTDKLHVRWYLPFDSSEVFETVEMGYLPENKVDWDKCRKDICMLPEANPRAIQHSFFEKWAPKVVAQYIIDTVGERL